MATGLTRAVAELAVETPHEELTKSARDATKRMVLDALGTAMAGWRQLGIRAVVDQMREWGGREEATLGERPFPIGCREDLWSRS